MSLITPNIIISNPIPDETRIYYSKDIALVKLLALLVFFGMGFICLKRDSYIFGVPICALAIYLICIELKGLFISEPQVIINKLGIQTSKISFYSWQEIFNEKISGEIVGRGACPCLEYNYPDGKVKIKVEPLNIRPQDLDVLLKFYRNPWEFRAN